MATARTRVLRLADPEPEASRLDPIEITIEGDDTDGVSFQDGVSKTEHPDGSVTFDTNPDRGVKQDGTDFDRNLAGEIGGDELAKIADELLTGIEADEQSRKEWLDTRARGIQLLGLKLEEPRGDTGTSSAPLEGMSTVRHPLLLEATVRFQANARGELLPAGGPVKVRNDSTSPPAPPPSAAAAGPPPPGQADSPPPPTGAPDPQQAPQGESLDELATALEKDMNHYLTSTASEYVPDTDRMLFHIGFGGDGFKKVYNCPLRRRPVSESVDADNIIVSNAATAIRDCGRVTHKIKMRPSIMRRMQLIGEYRDVELRKPQPTTDRPNAVDRAKEEVQGVRAPQRIEDAEYLVYESYCELDIPEFAPKQFKDKGLPLPYRVTLEKESRQVLGVHRNWEDDDEQALAKQFFVQFPFIRGLGFYGLGLIHILGNTTVTLTAAWRLMLDNGMFANFPGFLYAKQIGRQLTNQFRVPPGGGIPIELGASQDIRQAVMPLPYKETGPSFTAFMTHVEEVGQRLGQTANVKIGEGKQETPVGTIMATIEQATMILDSVHKRLHAAQSEEFALLKERFREDPEAFWRHNKKPARQWTKEQFRQALDARELVPVADPNNPTSLHRIAKAVAILTLAQSYQQFFNIKEVLGRIFRIVGIDSEGLFLPQPSPPPPDPRFAAIEAKKQAEQIKGQIAWAQTQIKAATAHQEFQDKQAERAQRERIEGLKMYEAQLRLQQEMLIHAHELHRDNQSADAEMQRDQVRGVHEMSMDQARHTQELQHETEKHRQQLVVDGGKTAMQLAADRERHQQQTEQERQRNEQQTRHTEEKHAADLEHKRALARVAAQAKPKTGEK